MANNTENTNVMDMTEIPRMRACLPGRTIIRVSVLTPMAKRKNMIPKLAAVSNVMTLLAGNRADPNKCSCPSSEGPNRIPPCNDDESHCCNKLKVSRLIFLNASTYKGMHGGNLRLTRIWETMDDCPRGRRHISISIDAMEIAESCSRMRGRA